MIEEQHRNLAALVESSIPIVKLMGLKVISMSKGHVKLMMPLKENMNHVGTMYAGSLFTLGEIIGGAIFVATFDISKYYPLVKDVQISYRKPALTDMTVEATLTNEQVQQILLGLEEKGKADFNLKLELLSTNGEIIAIIQGTWQGRKHS
jgi:thioesterase domain-containing protein